MKEVKEEDKMEAEVPQEVEEKVVVEKVVVFQAEAEMEEEEMEAVEMEVEVQVAEKEEEKEEEEKEEEEKEEVKMGVHDDNNYHMLNHHINPLFVIFHMLLVAIARNYMSGLNIMNHKKLEVGVRAVEMAMHI
jgi:hypothetical protein